MAISLISRLDKARKELKAQRVASLNAYDFVEQLTFLVFLKMAYERTQPPLGEASIIPNEFGWASLRTKSGPPLEEHYEALLRKLSAEDKLVGLVYRQARNATQQPATLKRLIADVVEGDPPVNWNGLPVAEKGAAFEALLREAAKVVGSKASQFYTNRVLIKAVVEVMRPRPGETIADPACGTGGFLIAARDHIVENHDLDRDEKLVLQEGALRGTESVPSHARLGMLNLLLHGIGRVASDYTPCITAADPLVDAPSEHVNIVLTNPPFGSENRPSRPDFWAETTNNQFNYLQQARLMLKMHGRAAVFVPDNVLFEGGAGETIRRRLLQECEVHTLLRLPSGTSYAGNVTSNVLFFDRRPPSEKPATSELWVYDLRTDMKFTAVQNPIRSADLAEFVESYAADDRRAREVSDRLHSWTVDELLAREEANLDLWPPSATKVEEVRAADEVAIELLGMIASAYDRLAVVALATGVDLGSLPTPGQAATASANAAAGDPPGALSVLDPLIELEE